MHQSISPESPPPGICHARQKNANAPTHPPSKEGGWAQVELTDALLIR